MTLADRIKQRLGSVEFDHESFDKWFYKDGERFPSPTPMDCVFRQHRILQAEITRRDEIWAKAVGKLERRLEDIIEIESLVKSEKSVLQSDCEETLAEILALIGQGE